MILHGEMEAALLALRVRQVDILWGHSVWRASLFHWSIDSGPRLLLLPAIDAVMRWHRLLSPIGGNRIAPAQRGRTVKSGTRR
jgi:hypothetical protein